MRYILIAFLILFSLTAKSQSRDSILLNLENLLFPKGDQQEYLYKIISCEKNKIDSIKMVRKSQPDPDLIITLLSKIVQTQNQEFFVPLLKIYHKHVENFVVEWSDVYMENFYACEDVQNQFNILKAFETTLRSLDFKRKNYSNKQIFSYYLGEMEKENRYIREWDKRQVLVNDFEVYSEKFRKINSKAWLGGRIPFHYLSPYLKDLTPYFIDLMNECNWSDKSSEEFQTTWRSVNLIMATKDQSLINYFMKEFEVKNNKLFQSVAFKYASEHFDESLIKYLSSKLLELSIETDGKSYFSHKEHILIQLTKNENNVEFVKNALVDKIRNSKNLDNILDDIKLLKHFPDEEILKLLRQTRNTEISNETAKAIDDTIRVIEDLKNLGGS